MAVAPSENVPGTWLSTDPCLKCLSIVELNQLKLAIFARAVGLNVDGGLDTILASSNCFNCLSDHEMAQVELTILWKNLANGVPFETLMDESKCLKCTDPKTIRAAILSLLDSAMSPVPT